MGAEFSGPDVLGFTTGAYLAGFLQNENMTTNAYGFLPFNAYGELTNDRWRIAAGLQGNVFAPRDATIVSVGYLNGSGNAGGNFGGQVRIENVCRPGDGFQLTSQVAFSQPVSTFIEDNSRIMEDNGWPNVEARVSAGFGASRELCGDRKLRPFELGASAVVGQLRTDRLITAPTDPESPNRAVVAVWGLCLDGHWSVTDWLGFAGELFVTQMRCGGAEATHSQYAPQAV